MADVLDEIYRHINSLQRQITGLVSEINANNAKIARLKTAKRKLEGYKDIAEDNTAAFKGIISGFEADGNWSGNRRDDTHDIMTDYVQSDYAYYERQVDYALDAVNDKITNLQNANLAKGGSITWLGRRINDLRNEVENYFN